MVTVADESSRGLTYGDGFTPSDEPVSDELLPRPSLEGIEDECRVRMAALVAMPEPRGWYSSKLPGSKPEKRASSTTPSTSTTSPWRHSVPTTDNGWPASPDLTIRPFVVDGVAFVPGVVDNDDVALVLG